MQTLQPSGAVAFWLWVTPLPHPASGKPASESAQRQVQSDASCVRVPSFKQNVALQPSSDHWQEVLVPVGAQETVSPLKLV